MSLKLVAPMRPTEQLRAIAASGSTGLARKAQAEIQARTSDRLARELALQRAQRATNQGGSTS